MHLIDNLKKIFHIHSKSSKNDWVWVGHGNNPLDKND